MVAAELLAGARLGVSKQAVYQVYTYRELQGMLQEAGFTQVEAYGSLTKDRFQLGSPGLWMVAQRV